MNLVSGGIYPLQLNVIPSTARPCNHTVPKCTLVLNNYLP